MTRQEIPVEETWDLSPIYPSDEAWEADLPRAREQIADMARHRGQLGASAAALRDALDAAMALSQLSERIVVYAMLRRDEDQTDPVATARYERAMALSVEAGQALAFIRPEILAIPAGTLERYLQDATLAPYRHYLDDIIRYRPHTRSVEVEELLAQNAEIARAPSDAFAALDNADLDFGVVRDEEGREIALTKARYQLLMESKSREVRRAAYEGLMRGYAAHRHTLAALYGASVRKDIFYARARAFSSAREAALFAHNIPPSVYDQLLVTVREAQPDIARYLQLRARLLGLERLAPYDLLVPLAPVPERRYSIPEAQQMVLSALAPLGEAYVRELAAGFAARWVDWHETKGKRSGAYSWGVYGAPPVILMNWNGTLDHVFTLAHEAGHAMHSLLADRAQPYHDAQYPIFLAEVASTVNEVLLTWHLLRETPVDDTLTRFSILNRFAETIHTTLVRQAMFAEFEHRAHAAVESGEPLTGEALNRMYDELMEVYLPGVERDDLARLNWSRVPHFYRAFYVYQYATGITAAIALARAIRDEGAPAAERYLRLLEAGGSDYPLILLQRAGVDLTTPEPLRNALAEFAATVAA
ncbi:MAG: oligoendopeptidase F, partial [Chloroflexota bacterium]